MRTVLLLLLGAALGLGAGWALGRASRSTAVGRTPPAVEPEPSPRPAPGPSRDADALLRDALAALPPPPPPPRGTARITGTVRTPDGAPVPGVVVRATTGAFFPEYESEPETLEEEVARFVAARRSIERVAVEATSRADGTFALTGLREASYTVEASLDGHVVEVAEGWPWLDAPGTVDFVVHTVGELRLDVVLPDGSRPAHAVASTGEYQTGWTPDEPVVLLPPGVHDLEVETEDHVATIVRVEIVPGRQASAVARLHARPGIHGEIRFLDAEPTGWVEVYTLRFKEREPSAGELLEDGSSETLYDTPATYAVAARPGRYLVGLAVEKLVLATRVVEVADGPVQCDFVDLELDPARFVYVSVTAPDGEPLRGVELETGVLDAEGDQRHFWDAGTDVAFRHADGGFLVARPPEVGEGERLYVDVESGRHGRRRVFVDGDEPVAVRFAEPAGVALTVTGLPPDVRLLAALTSAIEREDVRDLAFDAQRVDVEGRCTLGPVEAVDHTLLLFVKFGDDTFEAGRVGVRIRPGRNEIAVPAPRLHSLTVHAPQLPAGTEVEASPLGTWDSVTRPLGRDGRATFVHLPAGTWEVEAPGVDAVRVQLPGAREVVLRRGAVVNALEVSLDGAQDPLARHGLRDGDLVVGIGGTLFEDPAHMRALAGAAFAKGGSVALVVQRGGERVEVEVPIPVVVAASNCLRPATR